MFINITYDHMRRIHLAIMNFHYFVSMLTCINVNTCEWLSVCDNVFINPIIR